MLDLSLLKEKKYLKPLVIIVIVLILDFIFILRGQILFLTKIIPQANRLKENINTAKKDIASKEDLVKLYDRLNKDVPKQEERIIREEEIPLFLSELSQIAKDSGIRLMQMKPFKLGGEAVKDAQGGLYFRLPIGLDLKCGYHRLGVFISRLETSERYIRVLNFDVASTPDVPFEYPVKMTIETYVLRK